MFGERAMCEFASENSDMKVLGLQADIQKTIDATGFIPQTDFRRAL